MKSIFQFIIFSFTATFCHAMGVGLVLDSAVRESDAIIYCKILDVAPSNELKYSQVAKAEVLATAKGLNQGDVVFLLFDNGFACPGIHYTKNEEVLVFLKVQKSGRYETMNNYCGRFSVQGGLVKWFYMFSAEHESVDLPLKDVLTHLRDAVEKTIQPKQGV